MQIQHARFGKLLAALTGTKGSGSKLSEYAPILQPTWNLAAPGEDMDVMNGWNRCGANVDVTGGVGQNGAAYLANNRGSGILMVVESVFAVTPAAIAQVEAGVSNFAATATTGFCLDLRRTLETGQAQRSVGGIFSDTNYTLGSGLFWQGYAPGSVGDFSEAFRGIVLPPGQAFAIAHRTVASRILVSFKWRERSMEKGEERIT